MPADPRWINGAGGAPAYNAAELRRTEAMFLVQEVADRFGARSGVHPGGGNAVILQGNTVTVRDTKAVVYPGLTSTAGPYIVAIEQHTHTVPGADPSNPRKDIVVLRVWDDDEDMSGLRQADTEYIVGTPAASPSEPAVPAGAVRLATIDVPAGGSPVITYNAPFTVCNGGILPVRNSAELPISSGIYNGFHVWDQTLQALQAWNGSAWRTVAMANPPATRYYLTTGFLAPSSLESLPGTFTEEFDFGGFENTFSRSTIKTIPVDGWYRISCSFRFGTGTSSGIVQVIARKNLTSVEPTSGTNIATHIQPAGTSTSISFTTMSDFHAGDNIALTVNQNSGNDLNLQAGSANTWVLLEWARPL